jgi:D-alanine-D-alanine ligase
MKSPIIAVFAGGTSSEREVSLGSGLACAVALARSFPTRLFDVNREALPEGFDPALHVVFSTLHGTFGEDGSMQRLIEQAGGVYAGCGIESSRLTMNKEETKKAAARAGITSTQGVLFKADRKPSIDEVISRFGDRLVVKPNAEGSSVGLNIVEGRAQLEKVFGSLGQGEWLVEKRIFGHELAVGVLNGKAMGVVEVRPKSGVYDYASKYTAGMSEYFAPAPLPDATATLVRGTAERAFAACGCRDFARVDFLLSNENELFLLEINTLPGMKETSLLPMSARCAGLDFTALVREMVTPAVQRFLSGRASDLR